jgi:phosphoribosylformylglycinamidine (FGAM) synthase-like enzyme
LEEWLLKQLVGFEDGFQYFGVEGQVLVEGGVAEGLVEGVVAGSIGAEVDVVGLPVVSVDGVYFVEEAGLYFVVRVLR